MTMRYDVRVLEEIADLRKHVDQRLTRIEDKVDEGSSTTVVEVGKNRTEIRAVSTQLHGHEELDAERFGAVNNALASLRAAGAKTDDRVTAVEDTSKEDAIDAARAEAVLARAARDDALAAREKATDRSHDWRKSAVIAVLAAILSVAATAIAKGI